MFQPFLLVLTLVFITGHEAKTILVQTPGVVKVREGEAVKFWCNLQSSNINNKVEKFDVHWYHPQNKKKILLSHYINGEVYRSEGFSERFQLFRDVANNSYILTIRDVQLSDSEVYMCGIWGRIFGSGTWLNVTSANVPVVIQSPSVERVTEGQTARLQCTLRNAAVTLTDVHWYQELPGKDRERVLTQDTMNNTQWNSNFTGRFQPSRDSSNNSFILTITMVQPSDTAVYYCSVWGDISGNGTQLNVTTPLSDPVLMQYPTVSKVTEGQTVDLQCAMYTASVIDTDVHWHYQRAGYHSEWLISQFVNGTVTKSRDSHHRFQPSRNVNSNSYILTIVNVTLNDTAVYRCSVWSYIYGAGSQLNVIEDVESRPIISIIACALALVLLLCIFIITICCVKKWACFQSRLKPERPHEEELDTVYAHVYGQMQNNKEEAETPAVLDEGELFYADLQFLHQKSRTSTPLDTEETTVYAAVKYSQ